jgi:transglutaminase-like putative cysteine protease
MMQKRRFTWLDLLSALYLGGAFFILAMRLVATDWTEGLDLYVYLSFLAVLAGLALGLSRFPIWLSSIFGTIYGLFTIIWLYGISLDRTISWSDRVFNIMGLRLKLAISQYAGNIMVTDPILFISVLAILVWAIGISSGFNLTRYGKAWVSILPPGLALMIVSYYDQANPATPRYIFFFVLFTLLLVGRSTYLHSVQEWQKQKVNLTTKAQADLRNAMIIFITIVLAISWMIPLTKTQTSRYSEFWSNLTKPWQSLVDKIGKALEPLRNATIGTEGSFDATLTLGTSTTLGNSTLFTVSPDNSLPDDLNQYWKVRSYNLYMNDMWLTSNDFDYIEFFPQRFRLDSPDWILRDQHTYSFFMNTNQAGNFYFVNSPAWISRQVEFAVLTLPNGQQDVIAAFANPLLQSGETYQVQANVPNPTIYDLRTVQQVYPEWLERYTQLPPDFPVSISQLAQTLTKNLDAPYDKAQVITQYLRNNITYSTSIGAIPENVDPSEWFLFEHKAGYCNFYATAEVLMLRSIGIPARLAVGYAQGEYDPETGSFSVRQKDKHAWPEVYFNEYGWIEFEPTTSISTINRPIGAPPIVDNEQEPLITPQIEPEETEIPTPAPTQVPEEVVFVPEVPVEKDWILWLSWIVILVFTAGLALFIWWFATPQTRRISVPTNLKKVFDQLNWPTPAWLQHLLDINVGTPFTKAYSVLSRSAKILGHPIDSSKTPAEQGEHVIALIPDQEYEINILVNEYERRQYSPYDGNIIRANEAGLKIIKSAQYLRLFKRFQKK